jgi:methyltransferase
MVISLDAYLAILAALALERVFHLALAARNARRALAAGAVEHGQSHYPAMAAFHALFLISAAAEAVVLKRRFPGALGWIALCGALGAQVLRYWSVASLGSRWNTRIIVFPGMEPVVRGPYRFMRHPNYLAVVIEIAAVPMIGGAIFTAIAFSIGNALILAVRIPAEERAMGANYADALGSRRRFFPGLRQG